MQKKPSAFILLLILSMFLFAFCQGVLAQESPPADGTASEDGTAPEDDTSPANSIVCDLLLEDTTDELTDAIQAERIALFGTGSTNPDGALPFSDLPLALLFEAYSLLFDSMASLDRTAEFVVDMSVAACITSESAQDMVDKIHLARGKKGYLLANLQSVTFLVYAGLLERAIALEQEVLVTLIGSPIVPVVP